MIAIVIALFILLFIEVAAVGWIALKRFSWLEQALIPWMVNLSNHINPSHDTLPGDM
jgi:Na+-transporting NADH:ubiquinone oxidoreductase subunit NqrB